MALFFLYSSTLSVYNRRVRFRKKPALAIGITVFTAILIAVLINPLQVVQWKITDLFFRSKPVSDQITIIGIDDKSLSPEAALGRFRDWPRSYYAQLLRIINEYKPAVVAFDLDFRESARGISDLRIKQLLEAYEKNHDENFDWYQILQRFQGGATAELTHPDDLDFQKTFDESGKIVLAANLVFSGKVEETATTLPTVRDITLPIYKGDNVAVGFNNIFRDRDGVLRRMIERVSENGVAAKSFAKAVADSYNSPEIEQTVLAADAGNKIALINYTGKPHAYRTISFVDVLAGNARAEDFKEKIVLVGATAPVIQDFQVTPTSRIHMPGVEVLANIIQQFLENKNLNEQGFFGLIVTLLIFTVGGAFLLSNIPLQFLWAAFGIVFLGFPAMAFGMYQVGYVFNVVYPELAWILIALSALWYRNKTELKAQKEIKKAFSHYVSPVIVNELAKDPGNLALGGKRQKITVLFSDIVGFTTLAEKLSPEDTVALLNDYLTAMTEVIFAYNGTLDKYQGDAIMALFGAPLADPSHALNACHTALGMRRALVGLHEKWNVLRGFSFKEELVKLDFRVGIATGDAVVGNVGSEKRFDYTAIGDIVNLGSRLEGINKKYGTHIIVDKDTFAAVTDNHNPFTYRKLDTVRVKGKVHESEIFELVALEENTTSDMKTMLDDYENGRIMYTQRNFEDAKQYFESALKKVPHDSPAQIYRNRCNFYLRKPPGRDWSPIVGLDEK